MEHRIPRQSPRRPTALTRIRSPAVSRRDPQAPDPQAHQPLRAAPAGRLPASQSPQAVASAARLGQPDGASPAEKTVRSQSIPAGSRWPEPPAGSSLIAASPSAKALNLVASGELQQPASVFRLNSDVPREVADRIAEFMRSGILNRTPFSVSQDAVVAEKTELVAATPGDAGEVASASAGILSSNLMRISLVQADQRPSSLSETLARQSDIRHSPLNENRPVIRVVTEDFGYSVDEAKSVGGNPTSGTVEATTPMMLASPAAEDSDLDGAGTRRGAMNPFFGTNQNRSSHDAGREDAAVIDLIAGSRSAVRRDRIA